MCGIAGIVDRSLGPEESRRTSEGMCARIVHRGPDSAGFEIHPGVGLGMRRLAIVDIANGEQPIRSDDGLVAIVFNGEIYNAPALRDALVAQGVRFRTRSDTEVILRAYERDPANFERELRGMWAFAILDRRRNTLLLGRDRFGIKPLFIARRGELFAFASELRALETLKDDPRWAPAFEVNRAAAHDMLAWSFVPNEQTIYCGVSRLAPAHRLEVSLSAPSEGVPSRYWVPTPSADAGRVRSLSEACAFIEPLLRSAVREHLESDVDVAAFLSGGIDSSLVAAFAAEERGAPIDAFTIGFREPRFDESWAAAKVAQIAGLRHWVEVLAIDTFRDRVMTALRLYDEPFGDSSGLATYVLSSLVARTHKVALAGDGGDEAFAGYRKHRIVLARRLLDEAPRFRSAVSRLMLLLPSRIDRSTAWADGIRSLRRLGRGLASDDAISYVALTQIAPRAYVAPLLAEPADCDGAVTTLLARYAEAGGSPLQRTLITDLTNTLPNDMLTKVDRASMAASLEVRVPFLDHRVIEAGIGLPQRFTLGLDGRGKRILKALFERRFGRELAFRPKRGFGVPVEEWMRGPLASQCDQVFDKEALARDGLLSMSELGEGRWRRWARRDPQLLWNAFALAVWCDERAKGRRLAESVCCERAS